MTSFLRACGIVSTGGEAKARISGGEILVNGEVETRRGKKIKKGDRVSDENESFGILVV